METTDYLTILNTLSKFKESGYSGDSITVTFSKNAVEDFLEETYGKVYCTECGACGEDGCCPREQCKWIQCLHGLSYLYDYEHLLEDWFRLKRTYENNEMESLVND